MVANYKKLAAFALSIVAFDALSIGLVLPVLPRMVAEVTHAPPSQTGFYVGALYAIYAFMQFLFSPLVGGLSDRFGRRPVLLISVLCLGLNTLAWVWVDSLALLFVLRITSGLFGSNVSTASAYISDITPTDKRAAYFGLIGAMFGIGFVIGPAVGGILGQYWVRLPFLVAACLIVCNAVYGFFVLAESLPADKRSPFVLARANPLLTLQALDKGPGQWRLTFTWCALWLFIAAHQATFVLSNEMRFGLGSLANGLVLAGGGVLQIVTMAALVPIFSKKWGERNTAVMGLVFAVLSYLLLGFAGSITIMIIGMLVLSFSTLSTPTIQAMLSVGAGEDHKGAIQGALTSLQGLMLAIGPLVMGWLFSVATQPGQAVHFPGAAFVAGAIIAAIAAVVLLGFARNRIPVEAVDPVAAHQLAAGVLNTNH